MATCNKMHQIEKPKRWFFRVVNINLKVSRKTPFPLVFRYERLLRRYTAHTDSARGHLALQSIDPEDMLRSRVLRYANTVRTSY